MMPIARDLHGAGAAQSPSRYDSTSAARLGATKRAARITRLRPSLTPHACVLLAIDPGEVSGWALFEYGHLVGHGACKHGHAAVIDQAIESARAAQLPLIVVAERWTAGGWQSHATLLGLGAAWGVWAEALRVRGVAKRRIVRVYPQTWRAATLGGRQRSSELWKQASMAYAKTRFGVTVGGDVADAICIGVWGAHAGLVGAVIPKTKGKSAC
jgi:hypothetical protein